MFKPKGRLTVGALVYHLKSHDYHIWKRFPESKSMGSRYDQNIV